MTTYQIGRTFYDGMEGHLIETVENTYRPELNGMRSRVEKVGRTVIDIRPIDGPHAGKRFRGTMPKRASDVIAANDHTATFRIGRDDHTVTYRKVAG
jgi:hypothetical protein